MPVLMGFAEEADSELLSKVQEGLGFLNTFLDGHDFAVGDKITVADFALVSSVSSMEASG